MIAACKINTDSLHILYMLLENITKMFRSSAFFGFNSYLLKTLQKLVYNYFILLVYFHLKSFLEIVIFVVMPKLTQK